MKIIVQKWRHRLKEARLLPCRLISPKVLDKKWASYIKPSNSKPGTMYSLIKIHKENNPARVITSLH